MTLHLKTLYSKLRFSLAKPLYFNYKTFLSGKLTYTLKRIFVTYLYICINDVFSQVQYHGIDFIIYYSFKGIFLIDSFAIIKEQLYQVPVTWPEIKPIRWRELHLGTWRKTCTRPLEEDNNQEKKHDNEKLPLVSSKLGVPYNKHSSMVTF